MIDSGECYLSTFVVTEEEVASLDNEGDVTLAKELNRMTAIGNIQNKELLQTPRMIRESLLAIADKIGIDLPDLRDIDNSIALSRAALK